MDNRCDAHGSDEVSGLSRMINLLADTMQGMLTRLRSEAGRSTFSNQLVEALEMADSEAEADRVIARAMGAISEVHPMELLLADSSRAHLERACVHPKTGSPNCGVESPVQLHRGAPRASADLPRRRSAQCLPQVVRAHGRLDLRGLRAGQLHGARARRAARHRRQGQAAESRADRAAHRARRACRNAHRHAARLRAFAAAGEHGQPDRSHESPRGRGSAEQSHGRGFGVRRGHGRSRFLQATERYAGPRSRRPGAQAVRRHGGQRGARSRSRGALGRRGVRDVAARCQCRARGGSRRPACESRSRRRTCSPEHPCSRRASAFPIRP